MTITVFTSSYNHGEFLSQAIESVLGQSYQDIEYLLYDDGSTDDTWEIIQEYSDPRIRSFKLEKQPNVGCIINHSWGEMKGSAWVWCPADDFLLPRCIEIKERYSSEDSVVYSDWIKVNKDNRRIGDVALKPKTSEQFAQDIWNKCEIGFTGIYIPRSVIDKTSPFPEDMDCGEDYFWTLMAVKQGIAFNHLPLITHGKRLHDNRTTIRYKPDRAAIAKRASEEG